MMKHRDQRVTLMSQLLNAIRVIKYFNWEKSIQKEVGQVREQELRARTRLAKSSLVATLIYAGISSMVVLSSLGLHVLRGFELNAALIFACIALFEVLEHPFGNLSNVISNLMSSRVAVGRLSEFFKSQTLELADPIEPTGVSKLQSISLKVQNLSADYSAKFSAGQEQKSYVLKNWNLKIEPNQKVAIIGSVGSGKSSFLLSLLGEVPVQGEIHWYPRRPRFSYVSQEAYIINGTLRENLQFGQAQISDEQIMTAIRLASFENDFHQLSGGLETEIGEKGVNLSGGQKQRVSIARAILQNPEVILLDDPLSAVDVRTESELVQNLIKGHWKDRMILMVTHRLEYLSEFDQIIFVQNGHILAQGHFQNLMEKSAEFQEYILEHQNSSHSTVDSSAKESTEQSMKMSEASNRQTVDEDREFGAVQGHIYWDYIRSLAGSKTEGLLPLFLLIGLAVLSCLLPFIEKAWLSQGVQKFSGLWLMSVFGGIAFVSLSMVLLSDYYWMRRGLIASRRMHDEMLASVLGAKIRFFDSTPAGRIVQRFSRDLENIDLQLQWSFENTFKAVIRVLITLFLIIGIMPMMILFLSPVLVVYYFMQKAYRSSAREAKRMDSMTRSPRYAHFKETLIGLVTIRAFAKQDYFLSEFYSKLRHNQRMFYSHFMINRWFSAKIPLIGAVISLLTTLSALFFLSKGWIGVGTVGLLTIYSLSFWDILNWGVRIFADVEAKMTSVERVKFFSNLEQEKSTLSSSLDELELSTWPKLADIEFEQAELRYAPHLPLVLKGMSFHIEAGKKVGIIGRTGSGKSTLFQAIYRFVELTSGQIKIGGVNIASVPLNVLRRKLAIIPQDPTMFMGSLRQNLDRYNEYTDDQIWEVLAQVELKKQVEVLQGQLQSTVSENGANFSQGQRQLFCLARALLIDAPIIIMDEATASVDVQTDTQVQKVLREKCIDKTVLIIAHRLGTVRDCDLIIEVSNGVVKRLIRPRSS